MIQIIFILDTISWFYWFLKKILCVQHYVVCMVEELTRNF